MKLISETYQIEAKSLDSALNILINRVDVHNQYGSFKIEFNSLLLQTNGTYEGPVKTYHFTVTKDE